MTTYYNELDPHAATWLRELIKTKIIPDGIVDERSIEDVTPLELQEFSQCHFFAGIGGWPYALRLAGWPDDKPVWTGSCPCQPFSDAGAGGGFADKRHLWPAWFHLISQCQPPTIFGEQVASKDALAWFDLVHADLEGAQYAVGAADLCAAGVGAPHIRQRLYFVADSQQQQRRQIGTDIGRSGERSGAERLEQRPLHGGDRIVADANSERFSPAAESRNKNSERDAQPRGGMGDAENKRYERTGSTWRWRWRRGSANAGVVGDASSTRLEGRSSESENHGSMQSPVERAGGQLGSLVDAESEQMGLSRCSRKPGESPWHDVRWVMCRDGKARPVKSGLEPLVTRISRGVGPGGDFSLEINANYTSEARKMRLKGYGNSIVAPLAVEFIRAYMTIER